MRIFIGQIYAQPGINYPFSHVFQRWLGQKLTELNMSSAHFDRRYPGFDLMLRMSAMADLAQPRIKGPSVFRRDKEVEFSVFLPHIECDPSDKNTYRKPLRLFLDSVACILEELGIDASHLTGICDELINGIVTDPEMFRLENRG